jgi:predicted RNase H-like HicB family nuclease
MTYYHAIVHKDADSAFGVHFPDLPGCFSAADTLEEVMPMAVEAASLYLEDEVTLPKPRSIEVIRAEVAEDLTDGAFLILVPYIRNSGAPTRVNISLDRGMLDAIDAAASARKLTRSAFLAQAARNEIEGR